ncbi:hypothetical protein [Streptomyces kronopolitis]|uniref:hypothetical protein n=1 Tax=Streptomyces kronopolitis TaxID=1612435 RepID=UPI003D95DDDA
MVNLPLSLLLIFHAGLGVTKTALSTLAATTAGTGCLGLLFVPMALITANVNHLSPHAVTCFDRRPVVIAGLLIVALGRGVLLPIDPGTLLWATALLTREPLGTGGSLVMPALTSLMFDSVAAERAGTVAALLVRPV